MASRTLTAAPAANDTVPKSLPALASAMPPLEAVKLAAPATDSTPPLWAKLPLAWLTLNVDAAFRVPPDWLKLVPTVRGPLAVMLPPASSSEASAALPPSIRAPPFIWTSPLPAPLTASLNVAWPLPETLSVPPRVVGPCTVRVPPATSRVPDWFRTVGMPIARLPAVTFISPALTTVICTTFDTDVGLMARVCPAVSAHSVPLFSRVDV